MNNFELPRQPKTPEPVPPPKADPMGILSDEEYREILAAKKAGDSVEHVDPADMSDLTTVRLDAREKGSEWENKRGGKNLH